MDDVRMEQLKSLGVDIDETMERFVGNEELFFKCLKKFPTDKNYVLLLDAIKDGNSEDAFEAAHALKGVSANLGLNDLYNEVKVITEVFRAGRMDYDAGNLENIKHQYKRVLNMIEDF